MVQRHTPAMLHSEIRHEDHSEISFGYIITPGVQEKLVESLLFSGMMQANLIKSLHEKNLPVHLRVVIQKFSPF